MAKIEIDKERCKGCLLCVDNCPVKILEQSGELNSSGVNYVRVKKEGKCIGCGNCYLVCPDFCIKIYED